MRWRAFTVGLLLVATAESAPWWDPYLLKAPVMFGGAVVDEQGRHLVGVRVYGLEIDEDFPHFVELDGRGQFAFRTRSPKVVFRKPGYKSEFVYVVAVANLRVVMRAIGQVSVMPVCRALADCTSNGVFCLPKVDGVEFGKLYNGIDASVREIKALAIAGPKTVLTHGSGPSWVGEPTLRHVWESVEYSESYRRIRDLQVVDARGKDKEGLMWRSIGFDYERPPAGNDGFHVGERVDYGSRAPAEAALLDRVIDGICVTPPQH